MQKSDPSKSGETEHEHYPIAPVDPTLRAILYQEPTISTEDVDLLACGYTLTNLLCFARGEERDFTFLVEKIGDTLFFVRQKSEHQQIAGSARDFMRMFTRWDGEARDSLSHHRIIKYDFAGLRCVVKSECDAYLDDLDTQDGTQNTKIVDSGKIESNGLVLRTGGMPMSQQAIVKIETRATYIQRPTFNTDTVSKLWIRNIGHLIVAKHQYGNFARKDREISDCTKKIKEWETNHQRVLRKYADVLRKLVDISQNSNYTTGRFVVERRGSGALRILATMDRLSTLSEEVKTLWLQDLDAQDMYT